MLRPASLLDTMNTIGNTTQSFTHHLIVSNLASCPTQTRAVLLQQEVVTPFWPKIRCYYSANQMSDLEVLTIDSFCALKNRYFRACSFVDKVLNYLMQCKSLLLINIFLSTYLVYGYLMLCSLYSLLFICLFSIAGELVQILKRLCFCCCAKYIICFMLFDRPSSGRSSLSPSAAGWPCSYRWLAIYASLSKSHLLP